MSEVQRNSIDMTTRKTKRLNPERQKEDAKVTDELNEDGENVTRIENKTKIKIMYKKAITKRREKNEKETATHIGNEISNKYSWGQRNCT